MQRTYTWLATKTERKRNTNGTETVNIVAQNENTNGTKTQMELKLYCELYCSTSAAKRHVAVQQKNESNLDVEHGSYQVRWALGSTLLRYSRNHGKIAITVIMSNSGKTVNGEQRFLCRAPLKRFALINDVFIKTAFH